MCKTGKTGENSIIRVGSQYVTNVSVKGKVDKKSEDLWLPASRYLAFSFLLPRREETVYELETLPSPSVAKPAPLQFRPRTGVLTRVSRWVSHGTPPEPEFQLRGNSLEFQSLI